MYSQSSAVKFKDHYYATFKMKTPLSGNEAI